VIVAHPTGLAVAIGQIPMRSLTTSYEVTDQTPMDTPLRISPAPTRHVEDPTLGLAAKLPEEHWPADHGAD
jgi:hypothetical protein